MVRRTYSQDLVWQDAQTQKDGVVLQHIQPRTIITNARGLARHTDSQETGLARRTDSQALRHITQNMATKTHHKDKWSGEAHRLNLSGRTRRPNHTDSNRKHTTTKTHHKHARSSKKHRLTRNWPGKTHKLTNATPQKEQDREDASQTQGRSGRIDP